LAIIAMQTMPMPSCAQRLSQIRWTTRSIGTALIKVSSCDVPRYVENASRLRAGKKRREKRSGLEFFEFSPTPLA
jgi:hypothetical protein